MRLFTLTALIGATLASGCVVYDNDCPSEWDEDGLSGDHDRPGYDNDGDDTGDDIDAPAYSLDPSTAAPGDVFIGSLTSDQAINFDAVVDIEFLSDDVVPCTFQARADEMLVTVGVEELAQLGPVDMVISFEDGSHDYVEGALTITADGGSGDGGSGDGGSGDGGNGGNGGNDSSICG